MISFIPGGWKHTVNELEAPRSILHDGASGHPHMTEGTGGTERLSVPSNSFIVWGVGPSWLSPSEGAIRGKFWCSLPLDPK